LYADVIVDSDSPGISKAFTYRVPSELEEGIFIGACVAVPFGGRDLVGYVFNLTEESPNLDSVKDLHAVIQNSCALNESLLHLADWMSRYYAVPIAACVRAIVPDMMSAGISSTVRVLDPTQVHPTSANQQRLVKVLQTLGGESDADILKVRAGIDKFAATLRQLRSRGAVEVIREIELPKVRPLIVQGLELADDENLVVSDSQLSRAPRQAEILDELARLDGPVRKSELLRRIGSSTSPAKALVEKGLAKKVEMRIRRKPYESREIAPDPKFDLTPGQSDALRSIEEGLDSGAQQTTLLYGVTGSGKTEVYLRSIANVLASGRTAIALVPEISLTAHLMDAYRSRFGEQVAILHSRLSSGERLDEWNRIESGEAKVVLGARSAIFAPVRDLGMVIVDEEHEPSYKQDHAPRYNARLAAEERAREEDASVILGSATPAVETFHRACAGEIRLAVLEKRVDDRPMPVVSTVDLRDEFEHGRRNVFSEELQQGIAECLEKKQQVILFVNRRGYASFILCRTCGYTAKCSNCDVSLTYHSGPKILRCHHCNETMRAPTLCPQCGGPHIRQFGIGTEKVEEEVKKIFPEANVIRMDADTTSSKNAHLRLLDQFRTGKADILVGTQMVAKGLDFPNVTLVGVISADTSLHIPDFRAGERTFQLLTQVGGRGGRGNLPGRTIIQSFSPDHYAIRAAARQDFLGFYEEEIGYRRELSYPPFARLVNIVSSDPVDGYAEGRLADLAQKIKDRLLDDSVDVIGPAPAPISRLKGMYRWHLLMKDRGYRDPEALSEIIRCSLDGLGSARTGVSIDIDPITML
jgi:primosomal protein N' (replication factor Y)